MSLIGGMLKSIGNAIGKAAKAATRAAGKAAQGVRNIGTKIGEGFKNLREKMRKKPENEAEKRQTAREEKRQPKRDATEKEKETADLLKKAKESYERAPQYVRHAFHTMAYEHGLIAGSDEFYFSWYYSQEHEIEHDWYNEMQNGFPAYISIANRESAILKWAREDSNIGMYM